MQSISYCLNKIYQLKAYIIKIIYNLALKINKYLKI